MTTEQATQMEWSVTHKRWLDFAQRMALHGFPKATEERRERLCEEVTAFISLFEDEEATSWDARPYPCDRFREYFLDYDEERWEGDWPLGSFINQLTCCIRAGLDVAASPSAGVVGWTVGDVRRMYDNALPDWLKEAYQNSLDSAADDAGILL